MTNQPAETPPQPIPTFDPEIIWAVHRQKIIAGALVLVAILLGAGIFYGIKTVNNQQAEAAYAAADTVEGWQRVIREFPSSVAAGNSYLRIAATQRDAGKLPESDTAYDAFVHQFSKHPLLAAGYMGLASNAEIENHPDKALEAYKGVAEQFPNSYLAPMALFQQARLTEAKGNLKEAQELFERIVRRYPESTFASEAGRRAGRIADELAQSKPEVKPAESPGPPKRPES
ncbi:MAG TPA: tetratricopeptide repeat protein [Chthoniobacterales bacterium]|jgi:TolA-binding protein